MLVFPNPAHAPKELTMDRFAQVTGNLAGLLGLVLLTVSIVLVPDHFALAQGSTLPCVPQDCMTDDCFNPPCDDDPPTCRQKADPSKCSGCSCVIDDFMPDLCRCFQGM